MAKIILNTAQQQAVDHIYGPLLVLAGPGTGKTQLLSARIANILTKTDANAQNILCLTFTEAAAQNMRERLTSIIADDAYDVHINTYHGFGSDIIRAYPDYFVDIDLETGEDQRLERPIDQLQQIQIVEGLVNRLPYDSPLIGARHYPRHIVSTISELKRGLYTPESLGQLAEDNLQQCYKINPKIAEHLADVKRFPSTANASLEIFASVLEILQEHTTGLGDIAREELEQAMAEATEIGKSKPLTAWKNIWLRKNANDEFVFTDLDQHKRMIELSKLYASYQSALAAKQLYDFDDMILRTIDTLHSNDELRFTLQEKYQFILLDEFQDTNAAQFELVNTLGDNPVNEGQPNIFAVGDDDQAIYAFQGARVSNMLGFIHAFMNVSVVNLTENYRSHRDIIHVAHNIAKQIESRLHHSLENVDKLLQSSAKGLPKDATIQRHEFAGIANEYAWVSDKIGQLIANGTAPDQIAVLAPKHALLEDAVPFLHKQQIPMAYEKRENILDAPLIRAYLLMLELVLALADDDAPKVQMLLPRVLSLEFYQIPTKLIWQVNWAHKTSADERTWLEIAMDDEQLAPHVLFYVALGFRAHDEPLEYILDLLTGSTSMQLDDSTEYYSPLKQYYFETSKLSRLSYYESLANLSSIRDHLRSYQAGEDQLLTAQSFIDFANAYRAAEQPLINTHPIALHSNAVQLMTTYKAKGLEFEHVFLLSVHDDVWGKKARGNTNKLSLPPNLQHIRYQGSSEDELKRLLFVAITRAKHGLYLTSHANKDNGKATEPVKYLLETADKDTRTAAILPRNLQSVQQTTYSAPETLQQIETLWEARHLDLQAPLKELLQTRLQKYQMSPTHLNTFIDTEYGGPDVFLLQTLLRFPQAPGDDGEYGNAIHATLEHIQSKQAKGKKWDVQAALRYFDTKLQASYIAPDRLDDYRNRGHAALQKYLDTRKTMFSQDAQVEVDFRSEGVLLGEAHLSGKIDRLEIDKASKSVRIVDFKTGKPHSKWGREVKLLKYKQQLYFYKFLTEGSHTWSQYKVAEARLEFVEPDKDGAILEPLTISFDKAEEAEMKQLIQAVWHKIQKLDLPDATQYDANYYGAVKFIQSLLSE